MALPHTGADALTLHLCGSESASGLYGADASLGGVALAAEVAPLGWRIVTALPGIVLLQASGAAGIGRGTLRAVSADRVAYTAPGGVEGAPVTVADGATVRVAGANASHWVRVRRQGSAALDGATAFDLVRPYQSLIAHRNVSSAERAANLTTYRAGMLAAHEALTAVRLYILGSGFSIASETPGADGSLALPASETTAPSGMTWVTQGNVGPGLYLGDLAAGQRVGLRIRRVVPSTVGVDLQARLLVAFTVDGTAYAQTYYGLYAAPNDALEGYAIYVGVDGPADPTGSPTATSAGPTYTYTPAWPGTGTRTFEVLAARRNRFGLVSLNRHAYRFTINASGALVPEPLTAPTDVAVRTAPNGTVDVTARYNAPADASPGDTWAIYAALGADPDPDADTPTLVAMVAANGGFSGTVDNPFGAPSNALRTTLGPYAWGADVRVLVRVRRASDGHESANTAATAVTVNTTVPVVPARRAGLFGGTHAAAQGSGLDVTTTVHAAPLVQVRQLAGESQLWAAGELVWRCVWPTESQAVLYVPNFVFVNNGTVDFGAGTGPVDQVTQAGPIEHLYLVVAGRRRVHINLTTHEIRAAQFEWPVATTDVPVPAYAWMGAAETAFQVYDPSTGVHRSFLTVSPTSVLRSPLHVQQKRG